MQTTRFELLKEKKTEEITVMEYLVNDDTNSIVVLYTELLTKDGDIAGVFMTDQHGDGISNEEYPGLLEEIQGFLFPE